MKEPNASNHELQCDSRKQFSWKQVLLSSVIVASIIAVWVLPSGVRRENPRTRWNKECIVNLKMIDFAVQRWALENKKTAADTYSLSDPALIPFVNGSVLPNCPAGGRYFPGNTVANVPRCTIPGHTL